MKTYVTTNYDTHLDDLRFGYWEYPENEQIEDGRYVRLDDGAKPADTQKAAKYLEVSPKMIDALVMFAGDVQEKVRADMIDIWQRLDKIEQRLNRR